MYDNVSKDIENILNFFAFEHLPTDLKEVSRMFYQLANQVDVCVPENKEKLHSLRKLLEAKDCAIRACL